jgi:chaperonin GroEL (HSP60 family)
MSNQPFKESEARANQFSVISSIKSENPLSQLKELERHQAFLELSQNPYSMGVHVAQKGVSLVQSQGFQDRQQPHVEMGKKNSLQSQPLAHIYSPDNS